MDFEQFFKAIVIISHKMTPDCDPRTSLELLYNGKLLPIEDQINLSSKGDSNQQIAQLMEVLKDEYMVEILSCVHKTLIPYFHFYAHPKS